MRNLYTLLLVTVLFSFNLYAQTGPGGVGSSDGTSNLQLWLKPEGMLNGSNNPALNGETVETWQDASGHGHNGVTNDSDENTDGVPLDSTIAFFNGYPGLIFDGDYPGGTDGYVVQDINDDPSEATVMVVLATADFVNNVGVMVAYDNGNAGSTTPGDKSIGIWVQNDRDLWGRVIQSNGSYQSFSNTSTVDLISRDPNIITVHADGVSTLSQFANGSLANAQVTYNGTIQEYVDVLVGRQADEEFAGHIGEVVIFNRALNDAELIVANNYLASKFGISDLTDDFFAFDNVHFYDVAGIGQSGTDTHVSSYSDGILGINSPSALSDGDWLFFGHDGADATTWTTDEQINGDPNLERLAREWRINKTNDVGTVTISIDPTSLPAFNADFDFYTLWVDDDGDFSTGATSYPLTFSGGVYNATGVSLTDGQFITIGAYKPEINFVQTAFSGFETVTPASFQVNIDYVVDANITVNYTTGGTADEATGSGTFTISAGNTSSNTVDFTINNSDGFESDETIILTLTGGSQSHGTIGSNVSTYTIYNSDAATTSVQFDTPLEYAFKKTITIDKDMVDGSSDLENFPVLIKVDGADFLEIEGDVQSANGYDIRFTYENDIEWLDHQIELYDETNDIYLAWVKLPLLSATVDTKLEMYYGKSGATDPSSTSVFGNEWEAVYHLENANDGTSNGNNGTINGGASYASGKIGNGLALDGSNDDLEVVNNASLVFGPSESITLSVWYKGTDTSGDFMSMMNQADNAKGYALRYFSGNLSFLLGEAFLSSPEGIRANATENVNDDAWHLITMVYDGSTNASGVTIYKDGDASTFGSISNDNLSTGSDTNPGTNFTIGSRVNGGGKTQYLSGTVDEVRVVRGLLSGEWIKTEYNNMNDNGTLVTFDTEVANSGLAILESTDTVSFVIALTNTVTNDVTVNYSVTGGSAIEGTDFVLADGVATILANTSFTVITADLNNDATSEANENVIIALSNPSSVDNVSLGSSNELEFTITDDDAVPEISFSQTSISVNEGANLISYTVELNAASGQNITVDYTVTAGTATSGVDYIHSSGTLTIPADSTSATISFNVIEDNEIETQESLTIDLSNPINATLNSSFDQLSININDNDNQGIDGPAGVGYKDGSGSLTMWYVADSATVTGSNVTELKNLVGITEYDMITPASDPNFVDYAGTGTLNGHAEISFNDVQDQLATNSTLSASTFPYNEATTFVVTRHDNMSQLSDTYGTSTSQTGNVATVRFSSHLPWNGIWYYDIGTCCGSTARISGAYQADWVGEYGIFSYIASSDDGKSAYRNNELIGGPRAGTSNFTGHINNYFTLGQSWSGNHFEGDIVEFMLYTSPVNDAQRIIINNYLAAKYDLTISNDLYDFQASHAVDVAGIGQTGGEFHVAAKSSVVTVGNPSQLDDDEWIIFGHDNEDITAWNTSDIPSSFSNLQRIDREWRSDVTGTPGTASIIIADTELPSLPSGYSDYVLITDEDGIDWSNATVYPITLVDGEYIANDVILNSGTYFTVGTHIRTIEFVGNSFQDFENVNNTISLSISLRSAQDISIPYTISGTATGGSDYTIASGTFTISAENTTKTIDLGIIDETVEESDETIIVTLGAAPSGTVLGTNNVFTYTINDDDNVRSVNLDFFDYSRQLTINGSEVTGSHTDFPVLISFTNNDLRTVANGGNVQNDNGYDIAFYDSLSGSWLDHHLDYYIPTTGEVVAWVKIPTLSTTDVEITMFYGNSAIMFDQSSTTTWNSNYQAVWHMGSDNYEDGTANNLDGVDQGANDTDGIIGRAASFDGSSNVKVADVSLLSFDRTDSYTISAWYKGTDSGKTIAGIVDDNANSHGYDLYISTGNGLIGWQGDNAGNREYIRDNDAINDDSWHYLVVTWDGASGQAYVDANTNNTTTQSVGTIGNDISPNVSFTIGSRSSGAAIARSITGDIDEVRVSNTARSADWITTEFNNQSNPSAFVTVAADQDTTFALTLDETIGEVTVNVRIDPIDETQATTIDFGDQASGTALIGSDFALTPAEITIPAGSRTSSFTFDIINDLQDEEDETFTVELSNPSSNTKLGTTSNASFTITDDDLAPTIEFVDAISSVNEGSPAVTIGVQISDESGNDVTVEFAVTGGTPAATLGDDYLVPATSPLNTVTIPAGSLTGNIIINLIDDAEIEVLEDIVINLSNPSNATLGGVTSHTMTINDNDDLGFNGPGGVGEVDGSKTLKLWLAADSAAATGGNVTAWNNAIISVAGLDFAPIGTQPTRVDNAVNGHAEISFGNVNDVLESDQVLAASTFPYNEATFFIVTRTDNLNQQSSAYTTATNSSGALSGTNITAAIPNGSDDVRFDHAGDVLSTNYPTSWANGEHNIFVHRVTADSQNVWRNNEVILSAGPSSTSNNFTNHSNFNFYLGRTETDNFQGDIAEVIMFTRPVFDTQADIIQNYLAAKYGLTIENDKYVFDNTHGNEVAGIGQVSSTDNHVAAEAGVITISNASTLGNGDYVLFGHDNASISNWVTTDTPVGDSIRRVSREWRIDTTGTPGTITIALDTDLLPTPITGYQDYVLFVDADGDFTDGATVYQTTFVDGQYKAAEVPVASGDYLAVGMIIRTISFDVASSNDVESNSLNVSVNLNYAFNSDITFDYNITGGTATGGSDDYSAAATDQIQILAGQTTASFPLGIIDDSDAEEDETIIIELTNAPSGFRFGEDNEHTYTINDNDNTRKIHFASASSSADESVANVSLTIELEDPAQIDGVNETKAYLSVTGGTAESSPAPDFTLVADTVRIAAGTSSTTFDFTILDDVLSEADETIEISLSSPGNANIGTNEVYTYTIQDNESTVSVDFQDLTTTIDEGGSIARVVVELSSPSGQDVQVNYSATGGSATGSGTDYALADGTITITAGNQIGSINVALTDDSEEESAETIIIEISGATGASVTGTPTHTITLVDNDADFGFYGPGGVGSAVNNILWLDAENINGKGAASPADGSTVGTWVDRSGNSHDFTAISTNPTYSATGINNHGTIEITGSVDGFRAPSTFSNSLANYSFITVAEQSSGTYLAETNTAAVGDFRLNQSDDYLYHYGGTNAITTNGSSAANITTWVFDNEATNTAVVNRNGAFVAQDANFSVMALDNNFSVGSRYTGESTSDYDGNISEFIIYNKPINSAQQNIIENYLSSKYDITITDDFYSYDGTFGFDVIGIGQESDGQHLQSMSDSLLIISGASDLQDGEYVFTGHDNGDKTSWTTIEAPDNGSNVRRLAREWRLDQTGSPGTIVIKIDTTKLPTPPTGYDQYIVWTDDDGDFRTGATTYQVEYSPDFGFHVTDDVTISDGMFVTIGVGQPVIQFNLTSSSGSESDTNPNIEVSLNFVMGENVTVNYAATGGSAGNNNVDYLLTSGTLTIAEGQTSANVIPGIINDTDEESDETIIITLTTPSSNVSLGGQTEHTYTIHDDDNPESRTVTFDLAAAAANPNEDAGNHTVNLSINTDDDDNPTTVDLEVVTGSSDAIEGDDFTLSTNTITFTAGSPGQTTASFDIIPNADSDYELDETITIRLVNPVNADLGAITEYTVELINDDTPVEVQFAETSSQVGESAGTASIEVELSTSSATDVTVNYSVTPGTASDGLDYTLADGILTINAGDDAENILATIVNDLAVEAAETLTITISSPSNASLGSNQTHTLTITDDDISAGTGPAGIGNSADNILWLTGENFSSGTWTDISGNSNNFSGGTSPSATTNNLNFNGETTVTFTAAQYLESTVLSSGVSDYDMFFVFESDGTADQVVFDANDELTIGLENTSGAFQDQNGWQGSTVNTGTTPSIVQINLESGSSNAEITINGTTAASVTYTPTEINGARRLGIDAAGNVSNGFRGDIAEVIMFNQSLNSAQRTIMMNYLSTTYGISIGGLDRYEYDDGTANKDYYGNSIGIGREDADNFHVSATTESFFTISNPNDLGNGEYLIVAHNDGSDAWDNSNGVGVEIPDNSTWRTTKQWRYDMTGNVGTVSIEIDTTALPAPPENGLTWAIMLDADGDFSTVGRVYTMSPTTGDNVGVDNVVINKGDYMIFTLIKTTSDVTGLWNVASTWSTNRVPGPNETVRISSGTTVTLDADSEVGTVIIENTGTLNLSTYKLSFNVGCITIEPGGVLNAPSGSTVSYEAGIDQCVTETTYANLELDNAGNKFLLGPITVQEDLIIRDPSVTLDVTTSNYTITLEGNWLSDGVFDARAGSVILSAGNSQSINTNGGETFYNLTVSKDASTIATLNSEVSVENTLTMTQGNINLNISSLNIQSTGSISGGDETSYIVADNVGVLRHAITALSTEYFFPIGDTDEYSPFRFTLVSGNLSSSAVTINLRDTRHTNITETNYITRYWSLNNEGITGALDYNVSYNYQDIDVEGIESLLSARKFSSSGDAIGGSVTPASNLLTYDGHTSFSDHTGESDPVTLPVELLYFNAELFNGNVDLNWATIAEVDNSHFEIERSVDGIEYEIIGSVNGNGNSDSKIQYSYTDYSPVFGVSYYRLVQFDFDGEYKIYPAIAVHKTLGENDVNISLFPNPTNSSNINVSISSIDKESPVLISIINLQGNTVFKESYNLMEYNSTINIRTNLRIPSGIYQVLVKQAGVTEYLRLIIR
ncbi:DUF2341 domain-containing protein [Reichenbachiella versicolor]|uniref:DUF2341 domain-containing protein n=1 Tax=Reichenbachiella versicolor TaxID=1821036 RepID=UPI000D6DEBCE|nr:DUF2341 domain-containing protein [Reichenbachiella versicolor]